MFIVAFQKFSGAAVTEVSVGNAESVSSVANVLEFAQLKFTVSDRTGKLTPEKFGWGSFNYWVLDFKE